MSEIITPEVEQEVSKAQVMLDAAKNYAISTPDDYSLAAKNLMAAKSEKKRLDDMRKELKAPVLEAGKKIDDFFREPINFCSQAEQAYKKSILTYDQEQERLRLEEQRKAEAEARKQEQALKAKLEVEALEAMESGDDEKADEILNAAPVHVPRPVIARTVPKEKGISTRDNWKGEVTDLMSLVNAVANGNAPVTLLQVDTKVLGQIAKATKGNVSYSGVHFYNDPVIAARAL